MRVSYNWLKEYIDFHLSPKRLAEKLTMTGFEVGALEERENDTILEIEITPNRGDCLSMVGIGRQLSAILNTELKTPSPRLTEEKNRIEDLIKVIIKEDTLCPRYTARIVKNVKVGESPTWLKERLTSYGIRPINNIVDIMNYVMVELGNPMHAFDYDLLKGGKLIIRKAKDGEKIVTLDGVLRTLTTDMLVIADSYSPVAVAGVIGGKATEVTQKTENVLVECASFDPTSIRRTARALGIFTESSYRFERGVDPEGIPLAQARAAELLQKFAGGKIIKGLIDIYPRPRENVVVKLRTKMVNKILGTTLTPNEIEEILRRLGFSILEIEQGNFQIKVPSYYSEITREIDLIEEIARLYGYERIGLSLPLHTVLPSQRPHDRLLKRTREILNSLGLYEIISFGFVDEEKLDKVSMRKEGAIRIRNPLSREISVMRTTLLLGLLETLRTNINRGIKNIKIFEIGRVFLQEGRDLPSERYHLGVAMVGEWEEGDWRRKPNRISFYEVAGVLKRLFDGLSLCYTLKEGEHPAFLKGRRATIEIEGESIGFVGELSPELARFFDLPDGVYLFELDFDRLTDLARIERRYTPLPKYPGIRRDLSILVHKDIPSSKIMDVILECGKGIIEGVKLFDLYSGEKLGEEYKECKSLGYSIFYRDPNTTLTDEKVNEIHVRIIDELKKRLGARLRE